MGRKILVADDNISNRKDLQTFLVGQGFEVAAVGNGDLAAQRAGEMRPELALIDIMMPGKNGYEVCRHIKDELKLPIPVLLMYADFEPFDPKAAERVGADRTLKKPLDAVGLLETIIQVWEEYGFEQADEADPNASWADVADEMGATPTEEAEFPQAFSNAPDGFSPPSDASSVPYADPFGTFAPPSAGNDWFSSPASPEPAWTEPAPAWTESPPPVEPLAEAVVEETYEEEEESLDDPYDVVARGTYGSFFEDTEESLPTVEAPPAAEPPEPEPPPVNTDAELTDEETALFDALMPSTARKDTFEFLNPPFNQTSLPSPDPSPITDSVTTPSSVASLPTESAETWVPSPDPTPVTDPIPTPNPFAPFPTEAVEMRDFIVPMGITGEFQKPEAVEDDDYSIDPDLGTVRISGIGYQTGSISVDEVNLPYEADESPSASESNGQVFSNEGPTPVPQPVGSDSFKPAADEYPDIHEASMVPEFSDSTPLALEDITPPAVVQTTNADPFADSLFMVPPEVAPRVCNECGSPATDGDIFCRVCNAVLDGMSGSFEAIEMDESSHFVCRACGAEIKDGDIFCLKCGEVI